MMVMMAYCMGSYRVGFGWNDWVVFFDRAACSLFFVAGMIYTHTHISLIAWLSRPASPRFHRAQSTLTLFLLLLRFWF